MNDTAISLLRECLGASPTEAAILFENRNLVDRVRAFLEKTPEAPEVVVDGRDYWVGGDDELHFRRQVTLRYDGHDIHLAFDEQGKRESSLYGSFRFRTAEQAINEAVESLQTQLKSMPSGEALAEQVTKRIALEFEKAAADRARRETSIAKLLALKAEHAAKAKERA